MSLEIKNREILNIMLEVSWLRNGTPLFEILQKINEITFYIWTRNRFFFLLHEYNFCWRLELLAKKYNMALCYWCN